MDGRWKRVLAGGLLAGLVGCTTTKGLAPVAPPPPALPGQNTMFVPEPPDDSVQKDGPVSSSTKLIYANMCVDVVAKDPNKPAAERERLLAQARQIYQEVLAAEPKNADALMGLGQMYQVTGEHARLADVLRRTTEQHPQDARVWAWAAVKQGQLKDWTAAAASYSTAVKLDPDNRMYRIHLGFTLARTGRYDDGYEWLARSMRPAEARYNLAMMMMHNGDAERAKGELQRCLQADPNFGAASEKLAALNAGPVRAADVKTVGFEELDPVPLQHR